MNKIPLFLLMSFQLTIAADSFMSSCLDQMKSQADAFKSMRAELVQTIEVNGQSTVQNATVQYLIADRFYSKTEMSTPMGVMTMLCRGDTTYVKMGDKPWATQQSACKENPLLGTYEKTKELALVLSDETSTTRTYTDPASSSNYVFEKATCRMVRIQMMQNGNNAETIQNYQKFGGIDLPVRIEINIPGKAKSVMEYKSVAMNAGITKAFFQVK